MKVVGTIISLTGVVILIASGLPPWVFGLATIMIGLDIMDH